MVKIKKCEQKVLIINKECSEHEQFNSGTVAVTKDYVDAQN